MIYIIGYIGAVAVLVVFHELGHYWVARLCGVKVLRFSVGFGKVLYSWHFGKGETEWAISAVPLGGYVKMLDEREGEVAPNELSRAFNRKPVLQRMAIVAAGPVFNLLLAVILFGALFMHGVPASRALVGEVLPKSPAADAQMQAQETIVSVDGAAVPSWEDAYWVLLNLALKHGQVEIVGRTPDGVEHRHVLDMSSIAPADMNGEFMEKLGLKQYHPPLPAIIDEVTPGSPAERADLRPGDTVLRVNGEDVPTFDRWVAVVHTHAKVALQMDVLRDGRLLSLSVTPDEVTENGETFGRVGARGPRVDEKGRKALEAMEIEVSYGPLAALGQALHKTWDISALSLKMIGRMITGEVSVKNLSGPIKMAEYAGKSASLGLVPYVGYLALISVSLGVLNLLPIPVLDGGYLFIYYMAEFFRGRPMSDAAWELGQKIGLMLLAVLVLVVLYNDITSYHGIVALVSRLFTT